LGLRGNGWELERKAVALRVWLMTTVPVGCGNCDAMCTRLLRISVA
jgi:hypothetical protein